MPAKDRFHNLVKKALEKESWQLTHNPLPLQVDGMSDMYIRHECETKTKINFYIYFM